MDTYRDVFEQLDKLHEQARKAMERCPNIRETFRESGVSHVTAYKVRNGGRVTPEKLIAICDALEAAGVRVYTEGG